MHRETFKRIITSATIVACLLSGRIAHTADKPARVDPIKWEELKETALEYGGYSGRFKTCEMKPPYSIKIGLLKYARSQGASDKHLDILAHVFDEGEGRVRNLRKGFSPEECKQKLASDTSTDLNATNCPRGLDQDALNRCVNAINNEQCTVSLDTLSRMADCRSGAICMK